MGTGPWGWGSLGLLGGFPGVSSGGSPGRFPCVSDPDPPGYPPGYPGGDPVGYPHIPWGIARSIPWVIRWYPQGYPPEYPPGDPRRGSLSGSPRAHKYSFRFSNSPRCAGEGIIMRGVFAISGRSGPGRSLGLRTSKLIRAIQKTFPIWRFRDKPSKR